MPASSPPPAAHDPVGYAPGDPRDQPQALRLAADVWRAVCGHWRIAALFFVLANAAVLGGIMVCPRTYVSEAKLRVLPGRETATLSPTATAGSSQTIAAQTNREQDLNTAVDVLESRAVMEYAVSRIGPEPILKGYVPEQGESADDGGGVLDPDVAQQVDAGPLAAIGLSDPVSRYEKAVQTLGQIVEVNSNKKSDVISVSVEAEKPRLAQLICREVVAGFRQKYTDASEIEGSSAFFVEKTKESERALDRAATLLADELNALGISSVEGRRQQLQEELSRLSGEEMDRRKVLEGTLAEAAGYDRVLANTPETIDAGLTQNAATGAPDTLRKEIASLKARRANIVDKTSEKAPGAIRLAKEIESAERELTGLIAESDQTTTGANPVWQDLMKSKLTAEAKAEGLRAELAAIRSQREALRESVASLNSKESRILALRTERDELAKGHAKYVENREQALVTDEMGAQSISSVKTFQDPTFNAKPVAPKKRLIAAAGLVFAAFGALGLCLVLEYKSIFFPDDADAAAAGRAGGASDSAHDLPARRGYAEPAPNGYRTPEPVALRNGDPNGRAVDAAEQPELAGRPR